MSQTDLIYQDQSASALRLKVIEGELDTSQFNIIACYARDFTRTLRVEAAIIGASHYVSFHLEGQVIHEVLACVDAKASNVLGTLRPRQNMSGALHLSFESEPHFRYVVKPTVKTWEDGYADMVRIEDDIMEDAGLEDCIGLAYTFPQGNLTAAPKTLVLVNYNPGRMAASAIEVETVHAYPNEELIAFTQSTLYFEERNT